jgi:hypothetical protein
VLAAGLRRAAPVAVVTGSAAVALAWWLGLVRLLGLGLSQTSLNAALLLLALALAAYARALAEGRTAGALPWRTAAALVAGAAACLGLTRATVEYLAHFGATMAVGLLAVLLAGVLVFAPLSSWLGAWRPPARAARPLVAWRPGLALGLALLAGAAWVASGVRFLSLPQDMFAARDGAGESLAFFDRRFGGSDVLQFDVRGDLRDPAVAARLLRLTDLLEGAGVFGDVRSVAQVLGFLNHGFGGLHRIPVQKQALDNLWFFLEGSSDVKNLVNAARDEAMLVLRVPSRSSVPVPALVEAAEAAVRASAELGRESARRRLQALARAFHVEVADARIDAVVAAPAAPPEGAEGAAAEERVLSRMQAWFASPDAPWQPAPGEWERLAAALRGSADGRRERLSAAAQAVPALAQAGADELVETALARHADFALEARAQLLADSLWDGRAVPEPLRVRAAGVVADLLDPPARAAAEMPVVVSGMPAVATRVEHDLLDGLWKALGVLLGLGALAAGLLRAHSRPALRALLRGALATALVLALARLTGLQVDSGSATVFLLPPLLALVCAAEPGDEPSWAALLAPAAAGAALLFTGVLPMVRIGAALTTGLLAVAAVTALGRRLQAAVAPPPAP